MAAKLVEHRERDSGMSKQSDPKVDWGFHAVIPRLVRTQYETLTPVQKWLYVCLKDLCGEHGTCYRTLRVLADETGISTGMLSESIRCLHDAGLIHAEKKRRFGTSSKEVWHITIVDIWQANAIAHPSKRSHSEQSTENVHTVNNNVHTMNDIDEKRSAGEQKRSHSETEEESLSSIIIEEGSSEEREWVLGKEKAERDRLAIAREGTDAPTRAEISQLGEVVDETLLEVKTASGKHKVVSHSQDRLQENDEDISLAETAHRMPAVKVTSQQKPGAVPLPVATTPLSGRPGDASVQAFRSEPASERGQLQGIQDGAAPVANPPASSGPRASGKPFVVPARPTVTAKQRDLMPEPKPPTDKQINDRRAKEIWTLIEQKLETTFLTNQRKASKHTKGIEHLVEDQVTDETIEAGLSRLDQWEIDRFSVNRFYELLPGLLAKHRPGANNNTPPAKQGDQEYGVSGLPKLKPLGSVK